LASPDTEATLEGRRLCHGREDLKGEDLKGEDLKGEDLKEKVEVEEPVRQILRRLHQINYANSAKVRHLEHGDNTASASVSLLNTEG